MNAGLVMPYTIKALIGDKGIIAFFVLLFMALTSTVSSSMIAVSSILSFDLYKTYINPKASDRRLVKISHLAVVAHAIFITGVSLASKCLAPNSSTSLLFVDATLSSRRIFSFFTKNQPLITKKKVKH